MPVIRTAECAREGLRHHTSRLMAPITADPGLKVYWSGPGWKCRLSTGGSPRDPPCIADPEDLRAVLSDGAWSLPGAEPAGSTSCDWSRDAGPCFGFQCYEFLHRARTPIIWP